MYVLLAALLACGYSSVGNTMTGQVKKVVNNTPILCSNYADADISLGVLRDGVGSMSSQDVWAVIPPDLVDDFQTYSESGAIVDIQYDVYRLTFCTTDLYIRSVKLAE